MRARAAWVVLPLCALLGACGFHLRGREAAALPPALARVWVDMGTSHAYPLLLVEMRNVLATQPGVTLADGASGAAVLTLYDEGFVSESEVASLGGTPITSGYILSYKVSYRVQDANGNVLVPGKTVKLQRQHDYDRTNVVAKEKEQDFLRTEMQRDAVRQILRQLAALTRATP